MCVVDIYNINIRTRNYVLMKNTKLFINPPTWRVGVQGETYHYDVFLESAAIRYKCTAKPLNTGRFRSLFQWVQIVENISGLFPKKNVRSLEVSSI